MRLRQPSRFRRNSALAKIPRHLSAKGLMKSKSLYVRRSLLYQELRRMVLGRPACLEGSEDTEVTPVEGIWINFMLWKSEQLGYLCGKMEFSRMWVGLDHGGTILNLNVDQSVTQRERGCYNVKNFPFTSIYSCSTLLVQSTCLLSFTALFRLLTTCLIT